ncbi:MAG TPA: chemotaxis-specific protein-glutamate methyltransferase CheB [Mycobacteriales bacterium]|nr:chemotaxis-specific protein-glutamate methyltransferase CheB [Mycobacteriales bacterium]
MSVVVVDDSSVQRRFVRTALEADPALSVVGEARNGRDALALVDRLRPQVVLMDLHLPVMNGIEAIERIMAVRPTPILVYSAFVDGADRDNATAALAAGAVDVMEKPGAHGPAKLDDDAESLRRRLKLVGRVKVITHPRARLGGSAATMTTRRLGPARPGPCSPTPARVMPPVGGLRPRDVAVIAIGASTGGPHALATLLAELPASLSAAVVVVQHMADGFIEGLASWLDGICALPVAVGSSGRRLQPGTVTVAPSGLNLVVHRELRVTTHEPPRSQYHVPGIDVTFGSIADAVGGRAVGVLLTGMGRDGAEGLKRLRDGGAFTIAQDEATSAVYGMPAAAMGLGAVDRQLPLEDIGTALRQVAFPDAFELQERS